MSKTQALLDTCVVIDLYDIDPRSLTADQYYVSVITMAELAAGTHASDKPLVRATRLRRLQTMESRFDPLLFDAAAARSYGQVFAAVQQAGRQPRRRPADLLIASIAISRGMTLITRNADDFLGLESLLTVETA